MNQICYVHTESNLKYNQMILKSLINENVIYFVKQLHICSVAD